MKRDVKDTHIYFPAKVLADVKKMAQANRRTVSAEIVLAMELRVRGWKTLGRPTTNSTKGAAGK